MGTWRPGARSRTASGPGHWLWSCLQAAPHASVRLTYLHLQARLGQSEQVTQECTLPSSCNESGAEPTARQHLTALLRYQVATGTDSVQGLSADWHV